MTIATNAVPTRPGQRMTLLAAWGFVLAKLLLFGELTLGAGDAISWLAMLMSLGADASVVVWLAAVGAWLDRDGVRTRLRGVALPAIGVFLGIYAQFNLFLILEIGSPLTIDLLGAEAGAREAGTMLRSYTATLALSGMAVFLITALPLLRLVERGLSGRGRLAFAAVGLYAATAMAVVQSTPAATTPHGLHKNAVVELVMSLPGDVADLTILNVNALDPLAQEFPKPAGNQWTAPVPYDRSWRPKHVVLWLAESTGHRYTSLHDAKLGTTPNLLRLAEHSLTYSRYYANSPLSEKAIFGTLCGMYPYPGMSKIAKVNPRIACPSLMETLNERGYHAGLFTGALFGYGDKQKFLSERGFDAMVDGDSVRDREKYWADGWGVDDAAIVVDALQWIDERPDPEQPLLTVMIPIIPHLPYRLPPGAPTPFGTATRKSRYLNALHYSDLLLGRFQDGLAERGLLEDTLFVYVGDHGEAFEQHPGNRNHAHYIYEENLHVPIVFSNPRMFAESLTSHRLGSHADLLPTILDLLGQEIPDGIQGQSLVSERFTYRPVFMGAYQGAHRIGLRDGNYKYIFDLNNDTEEVYDLANDPEEARNLLELIDPDRVAMWRRWALDQQVSQKAFIVNHAAIGPSYLQRLAKALKVKLEDGDQVIDCDQVRGRDRMLTCPDQPDVLGVALTRKRMRGVTRECIRVHAPPSGTMVLELADVEPPPQFIGAGLSEESQTAGGTPLEITWRIGDLEPVWMVVDDKHAESYTATRVVLPDTVAKVDVRVEVRSKDWTNREGCLVLSP